MSTKTDKSGELRERIDRSLDGLARAIDEVRASEVFREFLDVQARFHRYSWHNCMLIASQAPEATQVAGFRTWKKCGRYVRKGEHGIAIFAPCPFKRTETDDAGNEQTTEGMFFKVVHVFDVSQTDGKDLPDVDVPDVNTAADDLLFDLDRVAKLRGIEVVYTDLGAGHYGVSKGGTVEIHRKHATGQQAKTLAHELAHEALHKKDRAGLTRTVAELEAELVAYVVCRHFRLDVEVRASRYIALWGGDAKALRESLESIAETARAIIDDAESLTGRKAVA